LFESQDYNTFMLKLCPYYVRLLCSTLVYSYYIQKCQNYFHFGPKLKQTKNCESIITLYIRFEEFI